MVLGIQHWLFSSPFRGSIPASCYWNAISESYLLYCVVLQGPVKGPILFLVYTNSLVLLLASHGVEGQFYVHDCQIYLPIANTDENMTNVLALPPNIKTWKIERELKVNEGKTKNMLIKGNLRTNVTYESGNSNVEASTLTTVNTARNLGMSFDPELSFKKKIETVEKCNFQICNINVIRIYLHQKCLHVQYWFSNL